MATSCYRKANTTVVLDTSSVDSPCSLITTSELFSPCCLEATSICLSEYLCYENNPPSGGSGFLTASCTDVTYASGQCTEHCTDSPVPDVIYNPDTGLWACCSWTYAGGVDCGNPTTETWPGVAAQALLDAASSSSSITGTATATAAASSSLSTGASTTKSSSGTVTSTSTSSPSSSATSSASSSTSSSSGLSSGAKAGIAIAVIAGVLLLALAFFLVWRSGKRSRQKHATDQNLMNPPLYQQDGRRSDVAAPTKYRDYSPQPVEMHSNHTSELPTRAPSGGGRGRGGAAELQ